MKLETIILFTEISINEFLRLSKKFAHELYLEMDERNFYDKLRSFDDDLVVKWARYSLTN